MVFCHLIVESLDANAIHLYKSDNRGSYFVLKYATLLKIKKEAMNFKQTQFIAFKKITKVWCQILVSENT